jgi:zinc-ribbon domain
VPNCPNCGTEVAVESRFCPECGRPLTDEARDTVVRPLERGWPPHPVLIVAVLVWIGAVILLVSGFWAWGVVAFLAGGILVLSQREAERRAARYALADFRERVVATRAAVAARSRGHLEIFRARRELAELGAERNRGLHRLGAAVFAGDKAGTKAAKADVQAVADRIHEKETEIQALMRQIDDRVNRAQVGVRQTERIEAEQPPEPVRVPEPWPPPDEGEPPAPVPVPEPSPSEPPPSPEHPPMPQTQGKRKRA